MTTAHKWTYDYSPATRRAGIIDATGYSVVRPCLSGRMAALIVAEHNRTVDRLTELSPAADVLREDGKVQTMFLSDIARENAELVRAGFAQPSTAPELAAFPAMLAALKAVAACPQAAVFLAMLPMPDGSASTYDAVTAAIAQAENR
jgi:hypothetical protein